MYYADGRRDSNEDESLYNHAKHDLITENGDYLDRLLVERDGEARSQVMEHVTGKNIKAVLSVQVSKKARIMTDELNVYVEPGKDFASHETVAHGQGEYVRGDVHINTAEGYFSQLKRPIDGTHHHVSAHHLHRYLGEFDYRYNTRKIEDSDRTKKAIQMTTGKRLMYNSQQTRSRQFAYSPVF